MGKPTSTSTKKRPTDDSSSTKPSTSAKKAKKAANDDEWDDKPAASAVKTKKPFWFNKGARPDVPPHLGSKELPEGPEDCLEGLDFVITGVLDSITREDAENLIKRHGGGVKTGVSKKTAYLLTGLEPGESKTKKAKELGTKTIDENGLFELIRKAAKKKSKPAAAPATPSKNSKATSSKSSKAPVEIVLDDSEDEVTPPPKKTKTNVPSPTKKPTKEVASPAKPSAKDTGKSVFFGEPPTKKTPQSTAAHASSIKPSDKSSASSFTAAVSQVPSTSSGGSPPSSHPQNFLLWVDKYQPKTLKNVVGQNGAASPAHKLLNWLQNWDESRRKHGFKATTAGFFGAPGAGDGSQFKACLLSGPPGLGKTTTATLACKESGFNFVHMNASDSRSKKLLEQTLGSGVQSHSLLEYMSPNDKPNSTKEKSALIMDEVDGMAGNEDRGGIAEVIQLIKSAKMPVICICNDRSSQKMRTLAGYCYDLRFSRPRVETIRAAMMAVCYKEGIKITPNALDAVIEGAHQDLRQTLHNLYMWTVNKKSISFDEAKVQSATAEKDSIKVGPFDAVREMFQPPKGHLPGSAVIEKSDLYFEDYNFVPLFVQENYLSVNIHGVKDKYEVLDRISRTADSLSLSDLIDREIRGRQNWSLLPIHAVFTAVLPGNIMRGHMGGKIDFPAWLGKNSSTNKNKRIVQDLITHMHLKVTTNATGLILDYLPVMRRSLTAPLASKGAEGIDDVAAFVNSYDLLREDMEPILDVTTWTGMKNPLENVQPAVKAALTRTLNKSDHLSPYAASDVKKGRAKATDAERDLMGEEDAAALALPEEDEGEEDEGVEKDAMIKAKKAPAKRGAKAAGASTSRGGGTKAASSRGKAAAAKTSPPGKTAPTRGRGKKK
ncbi:hypothetical protein RvY_05316 [Ramazzottius varieornatus]|uniref:Replication factor C subunit 1 n=1 Tax=Ramazzottius varieornatus TaxID=947166 RepID=A0A1D1V3M5_RAMVA|nr:hypothetical protein RvY_05316 [Ramazzottius varieornatus]